MWQAVESVPEFSVSVPGIVGFGFEFSVSVPGICGFGFGFAVSVEARRPVGTEYGLVDGMKKKFGMVYELGSLSDQLQKVTRQRGHKLVLHRLSRHARFFLLNCPQM